MAKGMGGSLSGSRSRPPSGVNPSPLDGCRVFAYAWFYVSGAVCTEELRRYLQEVPPGRPVRRGRISVPVGRGRMPTVRRRAPLSSLRGIPGTGRSAGDSSETVGASLMFDPHVHLPRINRRMAYLVACLIAGTGMRMRSRSIYGWRLPDRGAKNPRVWPLKSITGNC